MGSLGWHNPFPIELGGGPTTVEKLARALRSASGRGGSADDESSIDGAWRAAIARALAAAATTAERAALQAFPHRATDLLPYYERLLGLDGGGSTSERQAAAGALYGARAGADAPSLEAELAALDPRFRLLSTPAAVAVTTVAGRAFADRDGAEPFGGGRESTALPAYSSARVVRALLDLGGGALSSDAERRTIETARRLLHRALPVTHAFSIVTHHGFTLDTDRLDVTSLEA